MNEILNYEFFTLGDFTLKASSIIGVTALLLAVYYGLKLIKRSIRLSAKLEESKKFTIFQLIRYFVYVLSIVLVLQILGFNVSVLLAGSAALLVGIGLGMQNVFSDFVSGILILIEGNLKLEDIVEVNGMICKVKEINLRTTQVLTRDDSFIILPNSLVTNGKLINWTHNKNSARFKVDIGVAYASDVDLIIQILQQVASKQNRVLAHPASFARFEDYGDSALVFSLYFYTNDIFAVEFIKSDIRVELYKQLKLNNIEIPFPQRVLHIKPNFPQNN